MSEHNFLVKIDRQILSDACTNYAHAYREALAAEKIAIESYKSTLKFSWWQKLFSTHKLTSAELLRKTSTYYWIDSLTILVGKGLITESQHHLLMGRGGKWYLQVEAILESKQTEIFLSQGALHWVNNWSTME